MSTPAIAIGWEIWRKNRWAFIVIAGALVLCSAANIVAIRLVENPEMIRPTLLAFSATFMGLSILTLLGIFAYAEPNQESGFAFPARFFVLPITSGHLVAVLTLYGVLAISANYLVWTKMAMRPLGVQLPTLYHLVCLLTALITFQALVWGLSFAPKIRAFAIGALVFGLLFASFSAIDSASWTDEYESRLMVTFLLIALIAYVFAQLAVRKERTGGWMPFSDLFDRQIHSAAQKFQASSMNGFSQALRWMEWRKNGLVPSLIIAATAFPALIILLFQGEGQWLSGVSMAANSLLLPLTLIFCGVLVARDSVSNRLDYSTYLATHPCTTEALLIAKLRTLGLIGALTTAVGLIHPIILLQTNALSIPWANLDSPDQREAAGLLHLLTIVFGTPLFCWTLLVGGLPLWLTGRIASIPLAAALWLGVLLLSTQGLMWLTEKAPQALIPSLSSALALKGLIAIAGFIIAYRRRLLSGRTIRLLLEIWILMVIVYTVAAMQLSHEIRWPKTILLMAVPLLCPIARIALSPLALDYNRHR